MPKINYDGEIVNQDVELECKIGNQISLTNDLVWGANSTTSDHYSSQTFKMKIFANISTDPTGKARTEKVMRVEENPVRDRFGFEEERKGGGFQPGIRDQGGQPRDDRFSPGGGFQDSRHSP